MDRLKTSTVWFMWREKLSRVDFHKFCPWSSSLGFKKQKKPMKKTTGDRRDKLRALNFGCLLGLVVKWAIKLYPLSDSFLRTVVHSNFVHCRDMLQGYLYLLMKDKTKCEYIFRVHYTAQFVLQVLDSSNSVCTINLSVLWVLPSFYSFFWKIDQFDSF
jgi:hypothetical protein